MGVTGTSVKNVGDKQWICESHSLEYSTRKGPGVGLPGAKWLMDDFEIASVVGKGTTVTMTKWWNAGNGFRFLYLDLGFRVMLVTSLPSTTSSVPSGR